MPVVDSLPIPEHLLSGCCMQHPGNIKMIEARLCVQEPMDRPAGRWTRQMAPLVPRGHQFAGMASRVLWENLGNALDLEWGHQGTASRR